MGYQVTVFLEDGRQYDGDVLVGADGIWSKVGFLPFKIIFLLYISTFSDYVPQLPRYDPSYLGKKTRNIQIIHAIVG